MGGGSSKNAKHDGDQTVPPSRGSAPPSRAASAGPGKLKAAAKGSERNVKSAKRSQSEKILGNSGGSSPPSKSQPKVTPANSKKGMGDSSTATHYPTRLAVVINEAKELKDPTGKRSEKEKGSVYCVISVGAAVRIVESIPEQKLSNVKFANQTLMFPFSRTVAVGTDELFCTVYIHVYVFTPGAPDTYLGECQVQLGETALLTGKSPVTWHDLTIQDGSRGSGRLQVSVQPQLEKRDQQEVDEAIARMLEEEEARGRGGKGKRQSTDDGGDELIAKMLQEEEEKALREQQKRLAGGRPVAVH